jgi:DNA-binding MarR family transcriptional regulator
MLDSLVADWARERPDLDIRHKEVVYAIHILRSLFQRHSDAVLSQWGLNFNSYGVLATLRRVGAPYELAPTELAQTLGFTAGGMSNLIARLEEQDLLRRTQDATDRRCVRVRLTPKGKRVADEAATAVTAGEVRCFAAMPASERRQLYRSLRNLIDGFASR